MTNEPMRRSIGAAPATAMVMSNMIVAGVFTSLGLQALEVHTGFALLLPWAIGGVVACCGALAHAELGAAFHRSGGEYVTLTRLYGPAVGFLGGWQRPAATLLGMATLAAGGLTYRAPYDVTAPARRPASWTRRRSRRIACRRPQRRSDWR